MLFWHCSFSRGRCVVTLFGKCLCFACQCANQVLGNGDTKDLLIASVLFSKSSVPAARTNTLLVYKSPFCNRIFQAQNNFPWDIFWIIFFPALFQRGRSAKEFVCLDVCESVTESMFYSSLHVQTGGTVAPSRHDSGESVPLSKYSGVSHQTLCPIWLHPL